MDAYFKKICGSDLWDANTVYTDQPDFTLCFHNTILIWLPCLVLWLVAPLWIYMLIRHDNHKLKLSWLLITKSMCTVILVGIEVAHLIISVPNEYPVHLMKPLILIATYSLDMFLIHFERMRGLRSSTLNFAFWSFMSIISIIKLRTIILNLKQPESKPEDTALFFIFFTFVFANLILSCFSERTDKLKASRPDETSPKKLNELPEEYVSLLSKLSFWWINKLIKTGYSRDLKRDDLWELNESEKSETVTKRLEQIWTPKATQYIAEIRQNPELEQSKTKKKKNKTNAIYKQSDKNKEEEEVKLNLTTEKTLKEEVKMKPGHKIKKPSLAFCLCRVFFGKFLAGSFLKLVHDILLFVGPVLLDRLIRFMHDKNINVSVGLFYTAMLFLSAVIQSFVLQHYFHRMFIVGTRLRTSIMNIIYKKSLRLSMSARRAATVGEMTNLISVNAQSFAELTTYLNILWSAPFQIVVCVFMLWKYLGVASLIGVATMIIFIPLNIVFGNKTKKLQLTKLKYQDSRIKMMNEILSGIKVIKFYSWELSFKKMVEKIRDNELKYLQKINTFSIVTSFLWLCAPVIVSLVSLGSFVLIDKNNKLDASTAFVSLTLFNILRFPLTVLPGIITAMIATNVSLKRIRAFLLRDEIREEDITYDETPGVAIRAKNVDLGWDNKEVALRNLNMEVGEEKLVAIVGQVGSGKSSLLNGILGEMHKLNQGEININGSVAFVPQQAWIQNATVQENILFGRPLNEAYYEQVIGACSLLTDFDIMPAGDQTEIGEKGINLSGGQKQRISLARALYSDADIYLLDDPLSAVDSHVGKHIFDQVIGPNGLLKNKTRVFVTNSLSFLPQADEILIVANGEIVQQGKYDELRERGGAFADFIRKYLESNDENKEEETDENESGEAKVNDDKESKVNSPKSPSRQLSKPAKTEEKANLEPATNTSKAGEKIIVKEKIETGKVNQ